LDVDVLPQKAWLGMMPMHFAWLNEHVFPLFGPDLDLILAAISIIGNLSHSPDCARE